MIVSNHIKLQLVKFIDSEEDGFADIYEMIDNTDKTTSKPLLNYTYKLLNEALYNDKNKLKYHHFHFEGFNDKLISLIAELIIIKLFFYSLLQDKKGGTIINNKISTLETAVLAAPMGLSGKSARWMKILNKQKNIRKRKLFYEKILKINLNASLLPNALINILQREINHLIKAFEVVPFAIPIEYIGKDSSYVLLNTNKRKDDIDKIKLHQGNYLLDQIESIVMFDCEQKQIHRDFNFPELKKWNEEYGASFRNFLVFSFSEGYFCFNRLMTKIERIQSRFYLSPKYPDYETYTVHSDEIDFLLGRKSNTDCEVHFLADPICSFWRNFKDLVGLYEGLYELRSLKMMNIYSLVLNSKLKDYLLLDMFSENGSSKFLTEETMKTLLELSDENVAELRNNLSNTLETVINSNIVEVVQATIDNSSILILPELIYNDQYWKKEIITQLNLFHTNSISSWKSINVDTLMSVLILDYRDLGLFPYRIKPNLFENPLIKAKKVNGIFLKFFFKNKWDWTNFNYAKDITKLLNHPIRMKYFDWDKLNKQIQYINFEKEESFNWDFESLYQSDYDQETIKVKFLNSKKSRLFHPAELFILKCNDRNTLRVLRLEDIEAFNSDDILYIQQLDEIYSQLNLYEKLANIEREEREIQIIRDKYNLDKNETAERLWKILLKRKSTEKGVAILYEEVKLFLANRGLRFVSLNTFEKQWLNPESDSLITRGKRNFFFLCEYLGLDKTYVVIMLRIKNAEVQASRRSNKQMNHLLADLINDGCFNEYIDARTILIPLKERYIDRHDFDQIAVDESKVIDTLITLVELLKPEIILEQVETIERT